MNAKARRPATQHSLDGDVLKLCPMAGWRPFPPTLTRPASHPPSLDRLQTSSPSTLDDLPEQGFDRRKVQVPVIELHRHDEQVPMLFQMLPDEAPLELFKIVLDGQSAYPILGEVKTLQNFVLRTFDVKTDIVQVLWGLRPL